MWNEGDFATQNPIITTQSGVTWFSRSEDIIMSPQQNFRIQQFIIPIEYHMKHAKRKN